MKGNGNVQGTDQQVSVLFNEPKLLKFYPYTRDYIARAVGFSALQRAEIAEIGAADGAD